jgi:DNA mismatch endonuclease (patch repair protein)
MSHIRCKETKIECTLRQELWKNGIRYRKNYGKLPGKPDIAITKYKIAIFCDSEFFHGRDWEKLQCTLKRGNNADFWIEKIGKNIKRDDEINKKLNYLGWTVIRFWGKDILQNPAGCVATVMEAIFDKHISEEGMGDEE